MLDLDYRMLYCVVCRQMLDNRLDGFHIISMASIVHVHVLLVLSRYLSTEFQWIMMIIDLDVNRQGLHTTLAAAEYISSSTAFNGIELSYRTNNVAILLLSLIHI